MRVAILGNSGSGKSTLAAALAATYGVPCLDLDTIAWETGQPPILRAEQLAREDVRAFCRTHSKWVIEGCYSTLIEASLEFTPKLVFLNPGLETCLSNCRSRPWEPHKYVSKEEQDANLQFLLSWVRDYYTRTGSMSLEGHSSCFQAYGGLKREVQVLPNPLNTESALLAWLR